MGPIHHNPFFKLSTDRLLVASAQLKRALIPHHPQQRDRPGILCAVKQAGSAETGSMAVLTLRRALTLTAPALVHGIGHPVVFGAKTRAGALQIGKPSSTNAARGGGPTSTAVHQIRHAGRTITWRRHKAVF